MRPGVALLYDSHASRVHVMAMLAKSGLGDTVLQQHDRPCAIDLSASLAATAQQEELSSSSS